MKKQTTTQPVAAPAASEAITAIATDAALTNAVGDAIQTPPAKSGKLAELSASVETAGADYTRVVAALRRSENRVGAVRVAQLPHIAAMIADVEVLAVYYRKNTADSIKARIVALVPLFATESNPWNVALHTLTDTCGMATTTAANLLKLAKNADLMEAVMSGSDGVKLGIGVAYRFLCQKDVVPADYTAAIHDSVVPSQVPAWSDARRAARVIVAQWPVFAAARAKMEGDPTDTDSPLAARVAWTTITTAQTTITETGFTGILRDIDPDVFALVSAETERLAAIAATAIATAESSAAHARVTSDVATAATAEHRAAVETLTSATNDAKTADSDVDDLRKQIETAGDTAAAPLLARLKEAQTRLRDAQAKITTARADEETARAAADRAAEAARTATASATVSAAAVTIAPAPAKPTRPKADNLVSLESIYRAMDADRLRREMIEMTAALSTAGQLWRVVAYMRAVELGIAE